MKKTYCFDIEPGWGSHVTVLEAALSALQPGALVIEHGAGMFSSPLIASFDVKVICIEEVTGWRSWAKWFYETAGRSVEALERGKASVGRMPDAGLVFIDGPPRERADMLKWALAAGVPTVIAHDTEDGQYGYSLQARDGYSIEHSAIRPQTTTWRRL